MVLNVSSTGCNNERQLFPKLSCSAIDNILTNLLPAGLQNFFPSAQRLESDDGKQAIEVLPRLNNPLDLSLGIHSHPFSTRKARINALSSLVNGCIFIFTSTTSAMTSHRILITAEYLNAHFFSVFLFVFALQV